MFIDLGDDFIWRELDAGIGQWILRCSCEVDPAFGTG
jgi:hypothetical protein